MDTTTAGESPEVRGLAAADLDGDGRIEIVATTTQTQSTESGGAQVFVFSSNGALFQPAGLSFPAWPRYNNRTGTGGDADRNGEGHSGYGCYGLNVGIGNIDDDDDLEIIVTYDNHDIQAFKMNGVAIDASPWFTNRSGAYLGNRMTWGQFIRWADPQVEENHYHLHIGAWPHPSSPGMAAVDRVSAEHRRPGRRRQKRGGRGPQRREEHPLRNPGLRDHGPRRRARRRQPLGHAQSRLGELAPRRHPDCGGRMVSPERGPGRRHASISRATAARRSSSP